ncbi:MAG: molecular chaperone [Anaerolineae bacterium]
MDPRAELYFALSECYKEPAEAFARDVAGGVLYQVMADGFQALGIPEDTSILRQVLRQAQEGPQDTAGLSTSLELLYIAGSPETVLQTLKRAYYPLFVIPPHFVLPVESVFKEWAGEDGFLTGSRDMIMGPPATDMLRRYQAQGIVIPQSFKDYPDHLALLLEYGGLLCEEEGKWKEERGKGKEEVKMEEGFHPPSSILHLPSFVAAHLDTWIEEFAEQVCSRSETPFYRTVVSATVAFVQAERQHLEAILP